MIFYKGTVDGTIDSYNAGIFKVNILEREVPTVVDVTYVSPYFDVHRGGIFAAPSPGTEVLIIYDPSLREYFYLGTIVGKSKFTPGSDSSIKNPLLGTKRAYTKDNIPATMTFMNSDGAGLKINNYLGGKYQPLVKSVILETTMGHRLELGDTPSRDQVSLKNRNQEGIIITASKTNTLEERCIDIHTLNSIRNTSVQGEYRIDLIDGRDITIKNSSTGMKGGTGIDTPLGTVNPIPAGNLNLVTKFKDINIYTEETPNAVTGKAGRVLISTPQGVIQIKSGSDGITLYSEGNINIASVESVKLITIDSLGSDEILNTPNLNGTIESWLVSEGQSVNSGDVIGFILAGTTQQVRIPIVSPYKGTFLAKFVDNGNPVTLYLPAATILTDGGTINLQATKDINLHAGGSINMKSMLGTSTQSNGIISMATANGVTINAINTVKIDSAAEVVVGGPTFTMGTTASNINISNAGGPIYSPNIVIPEPVEPTLPPNPITPEKGFYGVGGKQP